MEAEWELFDVGKDLEEQENLFARNPAMAAEMQQKMRTWMREVDAQRPLDQASGAMLPFP